MKYSYNGQSLPKQFGKVRYDRILFYVKKRGMTVEEAVKWTETKHYTEKGKFKYNGKSCYQICKEIGMFYETFKGRVLRGWSIEDSLKIRKTKKQIEWEKAHGK